MHSSLASFLLFYAIYLIYIQNVVEIILCRMEFQEAFMQEFFDFFTTSLNFSI